MSKKYKIVKTMILYDNRHVKYLNHFISVKVVHQPFLCDYINELIKNLDNNDILHISICDSKHDGKTYLQDCLDILNNKNIVLHVINPKSLYNLPNCPMVHYYLPLEKGIQKKTEKIKDSYEKQENKNYNIILVEDLKTVTLNIGDE